MAGSSLWNSVWNHPWVSGGPQNRSGPNLDLRGQDWGWGPSKSVKITTLPISLPPSAPVVTGIDPQEIANALYGKPIPLSALGLARIGTAGLIFGPYFSGGAASFAVSFGFPANPEGTRRVYEVSLDGKVVWSLDAGSAAGALDASGFLAETFTARFYSGTFSQTPDSLETAHFGSEAVAYRPQMMLWFENLPLVQFGGKIPFVSAVIGDTTDGATPGDGINLGEALERIAQSPWLEYTSDTFDTTGVADIVQGMILTEDQSFLDLLRNIARVYRTLDILQTDKLRVNDRGSGTTPDLTLDRNRIIVDDGVQYSRQEEASVPRELEFITIDPDADYVFLPSKAARPRDPVPVTSSVGKETLTLPVIIAATTRASLVTYAKYQEENARKRVKLRVMLYGYELEPGDVFALSNVADGFDPIEAFKVVESSHDGDWTNEIIGEAILRCSLPSDVNYGSVSFYESGAQASTYTFNGADIGSEAEDRLILISGGVMRSLSPGRDILSVTVNGVECSDLEFIVSGDAAPSANAAVTAFMASMVVPSGITANVVINVDGAATGCFMQITRLVEYSSAVPHDQQSFDAQGIAATVNIDIPEGGICVGVYASADIGDTTWSGLTNENVDELIDPASTWRGSIASQGAMSGESGREITATNSGLGYSALLARSYV